MYISGTVGCGKAPTCASEYQHRTNRNCISLGRTLVKGDLRNVLLMLIIRQSDKKVTR